MCKLFIRNYLLADIENDQELREFLVGFGGGVVDCENLVENVKGRAIRGLVQMPGYVLFCIHVYII